MEILGNITIGMVIGLLPLLAVVLKMGKYLERVDNLEKNTTSFVQEAKSDMREIQQRLDLLSGNVERCLTMLNQQPHRVQKR